VALGAPLPDKAVMISFDDGRTDAMLYADPLLRQADMRATMFVISEAAAEPGIYYAGWDKLRAAAHTGRWDIQAHSDAGHQAQKVDGGENLPALTSLAPGETIEQYRSRVEADLARNSEAIQAHIGRRPVAFAYPFGAYGADRTNDPRIEGVLRDVVARRFAVAFHQDGQDEMGLVAPGQDRVGLRRLSVGNWSGPDLLRQIAKAVRTTFPPSPEVAELAAPMPPVSSPTVVRSITPPLPPVPFQKDLRNPAPILDHDPVPPARPATPAPTIKRTAPAPPAASTEPQPPAVTPTPATPPPPSTTSTTRPPATTTTTTKPIGKPPTTTTTRPPTTTTSTTTAPCRRPNGKPCAKQQVS
jgi:peptidoglycan/xylan/chitin deacetylase (PgdA/CDA1 family)